MIWYFIFIYIYIFIYVYSKKIPPNSVNWHLHHLTYLSVCRCVRKLKFYSPACMCGKPLQSCSTLCNLMDCSPPSSSVHGIFQARILEWVTMPFSSGSSWSRDGTRISCLLNWQVGSWPLAPALNPLLNRSQIFLEEKRSTINQQLQSQNYSNGHDLGHSLLGNAFYGSPDGEVVKNLPAKAGATWGTGLILGLGRSPREQNGNSLPYSCLENSFHGQRILAGYILWSLKE